MPPFSPSSSCKNGKGRLNGSNKQLGSSTQEGITATSPRLPQLPPIATQIRNSTDPVLLQSEPDSSFHSIIPLTLAQSHAAARCSAPDPQDVERKLTQYDERAELSASSRAGYLTCRIGDDRGIVLREDLLRFAQITKQLAISLHRDIIRPNHLESKAFCPHRASQQFFRHHLPELIDLFSSAGAVGTKAKKLAKKITKSAPKTLGSLCEVYREKDVYLCLAEWEALVKFLVKHARKGIKDGEHPLKESDCERIIGDDLRCWHDFYFAQLIFWPAVFEEGKKIIVGRQRMPFIQEKFYKDGGGSGAKIYIITLASSALRLSNGAYMSDMSVFCKVVPARSRDCFREWEMWKHLWKQNLKHDNILSPMACAEDEDGNCILLFPYCEFDLAGLLTKHKPSKFYTLDTFLQKSLDLFDAAKYLHTNVIIENRRTPLCHGDYNGTNIPIRGSLQSKDYRLAIADLGSACILYSQEPFCNSCKVSRINDFATNKAPELEGGDTLDTPCDVWSLGCELAQIYVWSAHGPDGVRNFTKLRKSTAGGNDLFYIWENNEPQLNSAVPECLREAKAVMDKDSSEAKRFQQLFNLLINDMLIANPSQRKCLVCIERQLRNIVNKANYFDGHEEPSCYSGLKCRDTAARLGNFQETHSNPSWKDHASNALISAPSQSREGLQENPLPPSQDIKRLSAYLSKTYAETNLQNRCSSSIQASDIFLDSLRSDDACKTLCLQGLCHC